MSDRLCQILRDLKDRKITSSEAIHYIDFIDWRNQWLNKRSDNLIKNSLITNEYLTYNSETPEDILLEKERMEEIWELVEFIKENISVKAFDVLWLYAVENWTQKSIGQKYNVSQQAIDTYLKRISKKIQNIIVNGELKVIYNEDLFREPQSILIAHSPETMGWPMDFLQEVSVEGQWKTLRNGRKVYESAHRCEIPEYFENCIPQYTSKTYCGLCWNDFGDAKCSRLEKNMP